MSNRRGARAEGDLDVALLQMRAEALAGVEAALERIDTGLFGRCGDCHLAGNAQGSHRPGGIQQTQRADRQVS